MLVHGADAGGAERRQAAAAAAPAAAGAAAAAADGAAAAGGAGQAAGTGNGRSTGFGAGGGGTGVGKSASRGVALRGFGVCGAVIHLGVWTAAWGTALLALSALAFPAQLPPPGGTFPGHLAGGALTWRQLTAVTGEWMAATYGFVLSAEVGRCRFTVPNPA
jgi:hypothetical protein